MEPHARTASQDPAHTAPPSTAGNRRRLDSWKEIGTYLERDARTVQRWEKSLGLPVHRQLNQKAGSVYAYSDQLDEWRKSRSREAEPTEEPANSPTDAIASTKSKKAWRIGARSTVPIVVAVLVPSLAIFVVWRRVGPARPADFRTVPFTTLVGSELLPSFSPDAREVAFSWSADESRFGIFTKALEGGGQKTIVDPAGEIAMSPVWSPDGSSLAYLSGSLSGPTKLWVKNLRSGVARKILESHLGLWPWFGSLAWMPDGQSLVCIGALVPGADAALILVSLKNGTTTRLTTAPDGFADIFPDVATDGKELAFTRTGGGLARLYRMRLDGTKRLEMIMPNQTRATPHAVAVWDREGGLYVQIQRATFAEFWRLDRRGHTTLLGSVPGIVNDLAVSRAGTLVFSVSVMDINLWTFPISGKGVLGPPRRCDELISSRNEGNPHYSPDGRRIAFESDRSGNPEIWVSDRNGAHSQAVSHFEGPVTGSPTWSPDGQWLAFDSRVDGHPSIYVVQSTGGAPRRVTKGSEREVVPFWSRDGKQIYFASPGDGAMQIWSVHPDGSGLRQITKQGGFSAQESMDGQFLYYTRSHDAVTVLKRVPVSGGAEVTVAEGVLDRSFAVTREGIYYAAVPDSAPKLEFLKFDETTPKDLAIFPKRLMYGLAVSPDGRELMFGETDTSGADLELVNALR